MNWIRTYVVLVPSNLTISLLLHLVRLVRLVPTDPPKFVTPPSYTVVGIEGESLQVAMVANANPMSVTYTWTKDGLPILASGNGIERLVSEGPILNITKLTRKDAGIYTCEAVNSQGAAMINITVIVECKLFS